MPTNQPPTPVAIFLAFANIGATGFGGVLPIARHVLVDRQQLMTAEEFAHLLAMCQILPGPNIINLTILYGTRVRGAVGAAAGLAGLMALPMVVILLLAAAYSPLAEEPVVVALIRGVAAAAAGLIVSLALRMIWVIRKSPWMVLVAAGVFTAMVVAGLPLLLIVAVSAPISIVIARVAANA